MEQPPRLSTFIVRVNQPDRAPPTGTVERARTGEKRRFHRVEAISEIIAGMLQDDGVSAVDSSDPVAGHRGTGPASP